MKINKLLNAQGKTFEFSGEITDEEFNYIFETGLKLLLAQGAYMDRLREVNAEKAVEEKPGIIVQ